MSRGLSTSVPRVVREVFSLAAEWFSARRRHGNQGDVTRIGLRQNETGHVPSVRGETMSEHDQWDVVSGVGVTALCVALARAIETHRPDGLVRDPLAEAFVAAADLPEPYAGLLPDVDTLGTAEPTPWWDSLRGYVAARTLFFDEFFAKAGAAGIRQAVLVAAGLDSRAFRLDWPPGTTLFELDQTLVLDFKAAVLRERVARAGCARRTVPVDLRDDWPAALRAAGLDPALPTAWLVEGLLSFIAAKVEHDLFAGITSLSAPGSRLAVESVSGGKRDRVLGSPVAAAWESNVGVRVAELWQTELRPEPVDVLTADGWRVEAEPIAAAARGHGRPVPGVMGVAAENAVLLTAELPLPEKEIETP
jgi:methyltransferase (TIGR00027 family)